LLGVERGVVACDEKRPGGERKRWSWCGWKRRSSWEDRFSNTAIVPVSAGKREPGLGELKRALSEAAASGSRKDAARYFRLPIDRAFAMRDFGSRGDRGTLISGAWARGDEVETLPARERLRVRGVQSGEKRGARHCPD